MPADVDAVVAGLKQDLARQREGRPRRRQSQRLSKAEQIRRFLTGAEMARVRSGEITPGQYLEYEQAMLRVLEQQGALEGGG